jgi:hypothetical protein
MVIYCVVLYFYFIFRYAPDIVGRTDMNQENRIRAVTESLFNPANNVMHSWLGEGTT